VTGEVTSNTEVTFRTMNAETFSLTRVLDGNGCLATELGTTAEVTFNDVVLATSRTECNTGTPLGGVTLANDEFQIVITVNQGDLASILPTAAGITFMREGTTNEWYSDAINETTTVDEQERQ